MSFSVVDFFFYHVVLPIILFVTLFFWIFSFYFFNITLKNLTMIFLLLLLVFEFIFRFYFFTFFIIDDEIGFVFFTSNYYWNNNLSLLKIVILFFGIYIVYVMDEIHLVKSEFPFAKIISTFNMSNKADINWWIYFFNFPLVFIAVHCLTLSILLINLFMVYIMFECITVCFFLFFFNIAQKATEFVLKYFVYIVFIEIIFLAGLSLLYASLGTLDMIEILFFINSSKKEFNFLFVFSLLLIILSFLFKIGIFPLHFYVLDLYRTTSFFGILIFSTIPKFVYFYFLYLFFKVILGLELIVPYKDSVILKSIYVFFFVLLLASIFFANFKIIEGFYFTQILAYSSISSFSLILLPFFLFDYGCFDIFFTFALFFLFIYNLSLIGLLSLCDFLGILEIDKDFSIINVSKRYIYSPILVLYLYIYLLSLSGLPFFLGFFFKFFTFYVFIGTDYIFLYFTIAISYVSSFLYSIRIFRLFLFDFIIRGQFTKLGYDWFNLWLNRDWVFVFMQSWTVIIIIFFTVIFCLF